jgi:Tfp pilus assembly protein PilN
VRAVNLMPRDDGRQAKGKGAPLPVLVGASGAIFVLAVLGAFTMIEGGKVKQAKEELAQVDAQLAALPAPPPPPSAEEKQLASDQGARITALSTAIARRVAWDRILREVAIVLPDDIWLQSLKATSPVSGQTLEVAPTPTDASQANGLTLTGRAFSQASVARLLSRMQLIPDLTNVQLVKSDRGLTTPVTYEFTIAADVRLPGGA